MKRYLIILTLYLCAVVPMMALLQQRQLLRRIMPNR